jgi:hypothetical protein
MFLKKLLFFLKFKLPTLKRFSSKKILKYSAALNIPDALKSALKSALPDAQVVFLVPWVRPAGRARVCQSLGRVFSAS